MFIETDFGELINPDHVVRARAVKRTGKGCPDYRAFVLLTADGEQLGESRIDPEFAAAPVVMAQPSFFVLKYWNVDEKTGKDYYDVCPVLAWRVGYDTFCSIPILLEESPSAEDKFVIERPDGHVILPGDCEFTSRAEWLRHARSENEKEVRTEARVCKVCGAVVGRHEKHHCSVVGPTRRHQTGPQQLERARGLKKALAEGKPNAMSTPLRPPTPQELSEARQRNRQRRRAAR